LHGAITNALRQRPAPDCSTIALSEDLTPSLPANEVAKKPAKIAAKITSLLAK
jgi:hypothetical protein